MFNSSRLFWKNKPAGLERQSSRQALLLRSHQMPIGRWHLKSLIITMGLLCVLLYYVHKEESQTDVKNKKHELVVRAAKPYKSPYSRRRHAKQNKDVKGGMPVKPTSNTSLGHILQKSDMKLDKMKPPPIHPNEIKFGKNVLNFKEKDSHFVHKMKVNQNDTFGQVKSPHIGQVMNIFKASPRPVNKNSSNGIATNHIQSVPDKTIPGQAMNKSLASKDGSMHQLSKTLFNTNHHLKGVSAITGSNLTPLVKSSGLAVFEKKLEASSDPKSRIAHKPMFKARHVIPEGNILNV